jgi:organic hydroperoxide reductase OsmC/OhrA
MGVYKATIEWQRNGAKFTDGRYSRAHRWKFDGGLDVPASSSPQVVPLPLSDASAVDPEEAFVASISSCHMLTFIWLAAKKGLSWTSTRRGSARWARTRRDGRRSRWSARIPRSGSAVSGSPEGGFGIAAPRGARGVLHRQLRDDGCAL